MSRPIVVDIDGTMSRPDRSIEGRVFDALHGWDAPVVIATGKAFPYPVAACDFIGLPIRVIAENGGVVCVDDTVDIDGDAEAIGRVIDELREAGYALGWGDADLVNRWRETELAVTRDVPRDRLTDIAARHGLEVVDSGFAYHVKSPRVSKGRGLETVADRLGIGTDRFVAIGDSENDVSTFAEVGLAVAVANADAAAKAAADHVTDGHNAAGLLEALEAVSAGTVG